MARNVQLLLVENVDNLGIVGDVVNVRTGYARNFLLPRGLATEPDEATIKALVDKRAQAEKEVAARRSEREKMIAKLADLELTMQRSCNDQGILYGSVTQQDLSEALTDAGYSVRPREVRLPHTIKRLGEFDIHIKLDADLECDIRLVVEPDRAIEEDEREEMEFDNEGNLILKEERTHEAEAAPGAEAAGDR